MTDGIAFADDVALTITRIAGSQVIIGREETPGLGLMLGISRGRATATADPGSTYNFVGSAIGVATGTGLLTNSILMNGSAQGTSLAEAFNTAMVGQASGTSSASSTPTTLGALVGTASGVASGNAHHSRMVGQANGVATADAFPVVSGAMVGQSFGVSNATAVQGGMLGRSNGVSTVSALPTIAGPLAGTVQGTATATAIQGVMFGLVRGKSTVTGTLVQPRNFVGQSFGVATAMAFQGGMLGQSNGLASVNAIPAANKGSVDDIIEFDKPQGFSEDYLVRAVVPIDAVSVVPAPLYINGVRCQEEVIARDGRGFASEIEVIAPVDLALTDPDNYIKVVLNETGTNPAEDAGIAPFDDDLTSLRLTITPENFTESFTADLLGYAAPEVRHDGTYIKEERFYSRFVRDIVGPPNPEEFLQVHTYVTRRSDVPVFEIVIDIMNGAIDASAAADPYAEQATQDGRVHFGEVTISGIPTHSGGYGITMWAERPTMDLASGFLLLPATVVGGQSNHRYSMDFGGMMRRRITIHRNGFGSRTEAINTGHGWGRPFGANSYYQRGQFGVEGITIPRFNDDFSYNGLTGQLALKSYFGGKLNAVRNDLRTGSTNELNNAERGWQRPYSVAGAFASGGEDVVGNSSHSYCREGWLLHRALADLSLERAWVQMRQFDTGAVVGIDEWSEGHGGLGTPWHVNNFANISVVHPFHLHPETGGNRALQYINHPWNSLAPGNVEPFNPRLFAPMAITHMIRLMFHARAAYWFTGDWPTQEYLRMYGEHYAYQANSLGVNITKGGPWSFAGFGGDLQDGTDIPASRANMVANNLQGHGLNVFFRSPGWGWQCVVMRYAFGTAVERTKLALRLELMRLIINENATPLGTGERLKLNGPCNNNSSPQPWAEGLHGPTNIPAGTGAFPDQFADWGTCAVPVVEPQWDMSQPHLQGYFLQAVWGLAFRFLKDVDPTKYAAAKSDALRLMAANFAARGLLSNEGIQAAWHTGESGYVGSFTEFLAPATAFTLWAFNTTLTFDPMLWCGMLYEDTLDEDFLIRHMPAIQGFNAPTNTLASVVQEFMTRTSQGGQYGEPSQANLAVTNLSWGVGIAQRLLPQPTPPPPST